MKMTEKLRKNFQEPSVIRVIGAHDGLSAKLGERNGFDAIWASGLEISTSFAVPDANILAMSQCLERACEMEEAVDIPIIADCDTGFGNVNNVIYMIKKYEAAGIAAICIEDKKFPKVNSYIPGRQELAPIAEFVGKIMAAKNAQRDKDFIVIARVEALIAGWGQDEALKRANAYVDAGADAVLIHSKRKKPEEIKAFCREWDRKCPLVVVPTSYPMLHLNEMPGLGIKMVIYANHGIRAAIKAINKAYEEIMKTGDLLTVNELISPMNEVFELQGMIEMKMKEKEFNNRSEQNIKVFIPAAGDPGYEDSMREIVKDYPIAMLDINGKSILERNVETLYKLNLYDITVITGYNSDKFDIEGLTYIENKNYMNTNLMDSLMLAEKSLNGDSLIIFSDVLFEKTIVEKLLATSSDIVLIIDSSLPKKDSSIDYVIAKSSPIRGNRIMYQERENEILEIGKGLNSEEAKFEFTGISYFSKKGIEIFKETYYEVISTKKDELKFRHDFMKIIQLIIDKGFPIFGMEVNSGWMEIRNFENYKASYSILSSN